jgi:hypothetical protein
MFPEWLSSCGGQGQYRYGARAFFTLKGYAGRNPDTELAFQKGWKRPITVPVLV